MDLSLSEDENLLAQSVRAFVERSADKATLVDRQQRRAASPPEWKAVMRDAGWLGLLVPEDCGGSGATAMQATMFFQEIGVGALPPAWLLSSGVSASMIAAAPPSAQRDSTLSGISDGTLVVVPALLGKGQRFAGVRPFTLDTDSASNGATGPGRLSQELFFVGGLADATHLLVPLAGPDWQGLALIPTVHPAVEVRELPGNLSDSFAVTVTQLDLSEAELIPADLLGSGMDQAVAFASLMIAAYQVGSCAKLLEIAVSYANERVQFGRTIGSFQRVQDHVVRIVNALDSARWLTYDAASAYDTGRPFAAKAWLARACALESHWEAANATHEVLAGVGSDPSFGAILHTSMSRLLHDVFGNPDYCRRRCADAAGWVAAVG